MKRSQLPPSTKPLRRYTWLKKVSARRLREAPARRACVAAVIERDRRCQFPAALARWYESQSECGLFVFPNCFGPLTAHEPAHRRNCDYTDPAACVASCQAHNEWAENEPALAYAIGWLVRGNGLRLRP